MRPPLLLDLPIQQHHDLVHVVDLQLLTEVADQVGQLVAVGLNYLLDEEAEKGVVRDYLLLTWCLELQSPHLILENLACGVLFCGVQEHALDVEAQLELEKHFLKFFLDLGIFCWSVSRFFYF